MKKLLLSLSIVLLLAGLNYSCTSIAANRAVEVGYSKTFKPKTNTFTNIEGNVTDKEMTIFKKNRMGAGYLDNICLFSQHTTYSAPKNYINVNIQDSNWRFIDSIKVRIDDELLTLQANSPDTKHEVMSGGKVFEEVYFILSPDIINKILNCSRLAFQYTGSPVVEISKNNEIQMIKNFFN
jgi:hypothetical protein